MLSLFGLMRREYRALFQDWPLLVLALCMPVLFIASIGQMYSYRKVTEIPVAIVDQDHSALSREIVRGLLAAEPFKLAQYMNSASDCPDVAQRNLSHICLVIPRYLERNVKSGRAARVALLVDSTNMLAGNVALTAASEVLTTYSVGVSIRKNEALGVAPPPWSARASQPVLLRQLHWFSPGLNSNYVNFMVLGLSLVPIQLAPLLALCRSGAREFESPGARSPIRTRNPVLIVAGKCLPYISILWPASLVSIHLPHWWFGVPMVGSAWRLALVTLCFISMLITLSFALSTLTRDPVFTSELGALLTLPNFLLSGFTWPNFAMPVGIRPFSYAFPMHHFGFIVRKIALMGASWSDCTHEIGIWLAWMVVSLGLALVGARAIGRVAGLNGARA
jgi:ABC-2 type transport system permease protein